MPSHIAWILGFFFLAACSTTHVAISPREDLPPPPQVIAPTTPPTEAVVEDGMHVQGLMGTLDPALVENGLAPRMSAVHRCFRRSARRRPYLGGQMTIVVRVSRDGATKRVRVTHSTVGSHILQRCVVTALANATYAKPNGGEAEFSWPLTFPARIAVYEWRSDELWQALAEHRDVILGVPRAPLGRQPSSVETDVAPEPLVAPAGLQVVFYVGRRGNVLSGELFAHEEIDDEFAERFLSNLKKVTFPPPEERYAKVRYPW